MASVDWRDEVVRDYRERIIIDPDNPILALKAKSERYSSAKSPPDYAGLSHLSSSESNIAIIWNVFRYLQKYGRLNEITNELEIGEPRGLLLWALAPELDSMNAELQYVTNDLMRRFGVSFSEGITEPDVTILGTTGVALGIGYNFSQLGNSDGHSWEGSLKQVGQLRVYLKKNPGFIKEDTTDNKLATVYQLLKPALFAKELGVHFGIESVIITLASRTKFFTKDIQSGKSAADWWDTFTGMLEENATKCKHIFWQDMPWLIKDSSMIELGTYILQHPYLYDQGPADWYWNWYNFWGHT